MGQTLHTYVLGFILIESNGQSVSLRFLVSTLRERDDKYNALQELLILQSILLYQLIIYVRESRVSPAYYITFVFFCRLHSILAYSGI